MDIMSVALMAKKDAGLYATTRIRFSAATMVSRASCVQMSHFAAIILHKERANAVKRETAAALVLVLLAKEGFAHKRLGKEKNLVPQK